MISWENRFLYTTGLLRDALQGENYASRVISNNDKTYFKREVFCTNRRIICKGLRPAGRLSCLIVGTIRCAVVNKSAARVLFYLERPQFLDISRCLLTAPHRILKDVSIIRTYPSALSLVAKSLERLTIVHVRRRGAGVAAQRRSDCVLGIRDCVRDFLQLGAITD